MKKNLKIFKERSVHVRDGVNYGARWARVLPHFSRVKAYYGPSTTFGKNGSKYLKGPRGLLTGPFHAQKRTSISACFGIETVNYVPLVQR